MAEKVISDPVLGQVRLVRRARCSRVSIRVRPSGVVVTMPWILPYAAGLSFLERKKAWALSALERQRKRLSQAVDTLGGESLDSALARWCREARKTLPPRLSELALKYGFSYNKVFLKHTSTTWGSCSVKRNINLNINLVRLPAELRDYVLLHELCHLAHPNHGPAFKSLLDSLCREELSTPASTLEKALKQQMIL